MSQNIQFKLIWTEPVKYYANGAWHDISLITENWLFDSFNQIDTIELTPRLPTLWKQIKNSTDFWQVDKGLNFKFCLL